jgi:hypothetical protein
MTFWFWFCFGRFHSWKRWTYTQTHWSKRIIMMIDGCFVRFACNAVLDDLTDHYLDHRKGHGLYTYTADSNHINFLTLWKYFLRTIWISLNQIDFHCVVVVVASIWFRLHHLRFVRFFFSLLNTQVGKEENSQPYSWLQTC